MLGSAIRPVLAVAILSALSGHRLAASTQQAVAVHTEPRAVKLEAARSIVPLLKDVRGRAKGGMTFGPGTVPDSPFAHTQTTLFAFKLSRRSVRVDPKVVAAIDDLLGWQIGAPGTDDTTELFETWLDQLAVKAAALGLQTGVLPCDTRCVVERMTTLDEAWGASPRQRADRRDQALLDSLSDVVVGPK